MALLCYFGHLWLCPIVLFPEGTERCCLAPLMLMAGVWPFDVYTYCFGSFVALAYYVDLFMLAFTVVPSLIYGHVYVSPLVSL